jgi:HlyD family secretion protein
MQIRRHLVPAAGLALVGAIAVAAMWPEPMPIDVAPVLRGPIQVTVNAEGMTRVRERFVVSAPVAGRLERIELDPGDPVVRGRTVVRLVPASPPLLDARTRTELTAAVESARAVEGQVRAERDRAAATQDRARSSLRRLASLTAAGAVAPDELEAAETAARHADSAVRAAEFAAAKAVHDLELARARLRAPLARGAAVEVTAPADGVVLRRLRESESVVPAGEPLLEIGDPRQLEIVADLLSADAARLSAGCLAFIDHGGGEPLAAHIRRIEPAGFTKVSALGVEEQRVNVIIDLEDRAAGRSLGDGYRVEVRAVVWQTTAAIKVPIGSLVRAGTEWGVFVLEGTRARFRRVQIGQRNNEEAEVLEGVGAGDLVILHPPDTLADGLRVGRRAR